ncbi:esterase/lipase family protein [Bradyrhizobium barranii]|uniref:esterase/lipase family protein n=1 Tax=Bradyrhizobium barranii TaxID=2992140 RepID=UPI004034571D
MVTILLVHGTFAVGSAWTTENSPLQRALQRALVAEGHFVECIPVTWSGRNRFSDRLDAARKIRSIVQDLHKPDQTIFLIGHSHGGSAIAYFLKLFQEEAAMVAGCVFLSTPFITLQARANIDRRVRVWAYLFWFMAQLLVLLGLQQLSRALSSEDALYYVALGFNFLFGCLALYWYRSTNSFSQFVEQTGKNIAAMIKERDSCDLPLKEYLFLKMSGDEASIGLSFAQSIAYTINELLDRVYALFARATASVGRNSIVGVEGVELAGVLLTCGWLMFSPFIVGNYRGADTAIKAAHSDRLVLEKELTKKEEDAWRRLERLKKEVPSLTVPGGKPKDEQEAKAWDIFDNTYGEYFSYTRQLDEIAKKELQYNLVLVSSEILETMLYGIVVIGALFGLILASLLAFGSVGLTELFFVETSVEVVPHGMHSITHLDWKSAEASSGLLRHSEVYSSALAIEVTSLWIACKTNGMLD